MSFAVGALLGAVFLELLPHALESGQPPQVMLTVLVGLLAFFLLEKLVLWRHAHGHDAHSDERDETEHDHALHRAPAVGDGGRSGLMILIGNGVHNFCDGIVIAAAFIADDALGVATTLAIVAHAVPQQVGDFAVLLHSGFARTKAFGYNIAAGAATLVGALAAYIALANMQQVLPIVLAIRRRQPALCRRCRPDPEPASALRAARDGEADAVDRARHRDHRDDAPDARAALTSATVRRDNSTSRSPAIVTA